MINRWRKFSLTTNRISFITMGNAHSPAGVEGANGEIASSIFDFTVENVSGEFEPMAKFKGKKHSEAGLEILAFPCNNFGKQEPGSNKEIVSFADKYGAKYPILGKLQCQNGDLTHPLYNFLSDSIPNGCYGQSIKWNFTKFLCDANGVPVKRFGPQESPMSIESHITNMMNSTQTTASPMKN